MPSHMTKKPAAAKKSAPKPVRDSAREEAAEKRNPKMMASTAHQKEERAEKLLDRFAEGKKATGMPKVQQSAKPAKASKW